MNVNVTLLRQYPRFSFEVRRFEDLVGQIVDAGRRTEVKLP
jgi:hypothetical protein